MFTLKNDEKPSDGNRSSSTLVSFTLDWSLIVESRASNHEPPVIVQPNNDPSSIVHTTMHANSHPASYLSLATYQNALSSVGNARQRTRTDFSANGLFIAPDRLKSNIALSIRPTRAPFTELPSIVLASQTAQRSTNPNARSRPQQTKSNNNNNNNNNNNRGTVLVLLTGRGHASFLSRCVRLR